MPFQHLIFILALCGARFAFAAEAITLNDAFRSALSKNEVVKQAAARVEQAQERVDQAKGAIYPNLTLETAYFVQPEVSDPIAREFFPNEQTTANLKLTQPLFRGLREFSGLNQRKHLLQAQKENRALTLMRLYEQVAASVLKVLALEQDMENLAVQQRIYRHRVEALRVRAGRGESTASEALTAEVTAASLEAEMRLLQSQLKAAREALSYMTGLPADSRLADRTSTDFALAPLADYLAGIEKRPDVKMASENLQAAQEEISFIRRGHWPTLDLTGNYYLKRPDGYLSDVEWDAEFRLTLPLYEGGTRVSQTREAMSRKKEAELELQRLRRQAASDIRTLYEGLQLRQGQLTALKRSSELAQKNYQVLERDERRGLTRNIDVQLGLTEYRAAQRSYDQARYDGHLDLIRLRTAAAIWPAPLADSVAAVRPATSTRKEIPTKAVE